MFDRWTDPGSVTALRILVACAALTFILAVSWAAALWAAYSTAKLPDGVDAAAADFHDKFYSAADRGADAERTGAAKRNKTARGVAGKGAKSSGSSVDAGDLGAGSAANSNDANQPAKQTR